VLGLEGCRGAALSLDGHEQVKILITESLATYCIV
jgi:hypothetical protein